MRELSYVLRFERAAKGEPTVATGLVTISSLPLAGAPVETTRVPTGGRVSYESVPTVEPDNIRFTETGTITFGDTPEHTLHFVTLGFGYLSPPADPATNLTPGIVMWEVDSGTGFFEGATGLIASNFRVDLDKERLVDDQVGWIRLPDGAAT